MDRKKSSNSDIEVVVELVGGHTAATEAQRPNKATRLCMDSDCMQAFNLLKLWDFMTTSTAVNYSYIVF